MSCPEVNINYCNAAGQCTASSINDEINCHYCKHLGCYRANCCVLRTLSAGCMSPEAVKAAKETARIVSKVIDATTKEG